MMAHIEQDDMRHSILNVCEKDCDLIIHSSQIICTETLVFDIMCQDILQNQHKKIRTVNQMLYLKDQSHCINANV